MPVGRVKNDPYLQGILWVILLCVIGGVIAIVVIGSKDTEQWCTRDLSEPVVATHLLGLIPLFLAIVFRMPLTSIAILCSLVSSLFYHVLCEQSTQPVMNYIDVFFAHFVLLLFIVLLFVAITLRSDEYFMSFALVMAIFAIVMFLLPSVIDKDDRCLWQRYHAMWHLVAFVAMTFILLAFNPKSIPESALSQHRWLRHFQQYHF